MKNLKEELKYCKKGITIIALVITIIVLLILAGVTIMILKEANGIFNKANEAKVQVRIAEEKEIIKLEMLQEKKIGTPLYDKTIANGDKWHIIMQNDDIYGTGWSYIRKGTRLENFETKYNWIIDESSGEIKILTEGEYSELSYDMTLSVKDSIILNVTPSNMQDEGSWGEGVTLYGKQEDEGEWSENELTFDGVDDYLEVYTNTELNKGITFEFYGKSENSQLPMLAKTVKGDTVNYSKRFRTIFFENSFRCCMSGLDSQSDWKESGNNKHWIKKENVGSFNQIEEDSYLTMTADFIKNEISLYWNGEHIGTTSCSHDWLINGEITNNKIPFTIGLLVQDKTYTEYYSKVSLYACRLYGRVLNEEEIKENYIKTSNYHKLVVNME